MTAYKIAAGLAGAAYLNARLGNDLAMASGLINARIGLAGENRRDQNSLYYYFDRAHKKKGDADCYVCEDQTLSFNQVAIGSFPSVSSLCFPHLTDDLEHVYRTEVNRLAHWLLSQGLQVSLLSSIALIRETV